ncbi:5230_t:CDS:2, partial [Gigaspora margarita]
YGIQHIELVCIIRGINKEYDYIQYKIAQDQQILAEKMELLKINKNKNQSNKMVNQLEYGTYNYSTRELQAIINKNKSEYRSYKYKLEARELQEKIIRTNRTTHLLEREGSIDIEMLEKEEKENEKSCSTKVDYLAHNKARKDISKSRWAQYNRIKNT